MKRADIVASARHFVDVGTKWSTRGHSDRGTNCGGIILMTMEKFGLPYDPYVGSIIMPDGPQIVKMFKKALNITSVVNIKPGMVLLMQTEAMPHHLAITAEKFGKISIIHMASERRKACEEILTDELRKHVYMAFEFPGIED